MVGVQLLTGLIGQRMLYPTLYLAQFPLQSILAHHNSTSKSKRRKLLRSPPPLYIGSEGAIFTVRSAVHKLTADVKTYPLH